MYLLAIETTGPQLSVATIDEEGHVKEEFAPAGFNHLTNLMPLVEKITTEQGLDLQDAAAIAVSRGPGSFTGIRIGVSTARALAQALDLKAVAVPTLEAFLYNVPDFKGAICPIFDARRSQVYGGAFAWADGREEGKCRPGRDYIEVVPAGAYTLDEYLGLLEEGLRKHKISEIVAFGDGMKPYGAKFKTFAEEAGTGFTDATGLTDSKAEASATGIKAEAASDGGHDVAAIKDAGRQEGFAAGSVQAAGSVARLGLALYKEGKTCGFAELLPDYMRKAEAERKLEEKQAAEK